MLRRVHQVHSKSTWAESCRSLVVARVVLLRNTGEVLLEVGRSVLCQLELHGKKKAACVQLGVNVIRPFAPSKGVRV